MLLYIQEARLPADSVRDYLTSKGVDSGLIDTEGRGKRDPVASNATKEGRAQNRRVEVHVDGFAHDRALMVG